MSALAQRADRAIAPLDEGPLPLWTRWVGAYQRHAFAALLRLPAALKRLAAFRYRDALKRGLDLDLAFMLTLDAAANASDLRGLSLERARRKVAAGVLTTTLHGPASVAVEDLSLPGPACALPLRLYRPAGAAAGGPLVFYIHGGGWVTGSLATHDGLCRWLAARLGWAVSSVGYRLAPEAPFPAAVEDVLAAFRHVAARAAGLGVDPQRIAVMGDSAGGNLSAVAALELRGEALRPALQVLLYPALDAARALPSHRAVGDRYYLTAPMVDWYYGHYVGREPPASPDASPLAAPSLAGVCPALVYTCAFDPLVDEGDAYAARLRAEGVPTTHRRFENMIHGYGLMAGAIPACRAALETTASDLAAFADWPR